MTSFPMNQATQETPASEQADDDIELVEKFIQDRRLEDARKAFRRFLISQAAGAPEDATVGDALALLAKNPARNSVATIVLLRCMAVQGLLPEPNAVNQIVRSTIELCEGGLPEIISFLKISKSSQNYEKFAFLSTFHQKIEEILSPLTLPYGDLDALLNARKQILGALNHSIVRQYAGPFKLKEIRSTIEAVFSKLKRVSAIETTLLIDVEDCNRAVLSASGDLRVPDSFLSRGYLDNFLFTCERVLADFLNTMRGRFAATISVASITGNELQKRYPLHEASRQIQIVIPLRNSGPGMATDVRVTAVETGSDVVFSSAAVILGNVLPGDFSVAIDAMVITPCAGFVGCLQIEWGEIGSPTVRSEIFEFSVIAQSSTIDWQSLEYQAPYNTNVAEGGEFIGRLDKVRFVAAKLLRRPMEPFFLTGQKRVGKTSLAFAAAQYAKENVQVGTLDYEYILWGAIAHVDPVVSIRQLGEKIEDFIRKFLPEGFNSPKGNYEGSLAGLINLSELALRLVPTRCFVVILDEFDEMPPELYLQGNLAETLFGNLRALSRCKNLCLVIIGGENLPFIMDRQGQKLNNYSRINLSYFSRETEWADFQLMVRSPTAGILNWYDDAISEVFNVTNGNPFFTKKVCACIFSSAVAGRDADVTANEVRRATESEVSSLGANSFAHLWQDGIPKAASEREPDILRRMRVLVAIARCLRRGFPTTIGHIVESKTLNSLSEIEISAALNDFQRRNILSDEDKEYKFNLPIFRSWLIDVGVSELIADSLHEELANSVLAEEVSVAVLSEEIVELSRNLPTYRGKHIGTDEIRAWYQQVTSPQEQRILFELLKRTRVFSEALVRERLKAVHSFLRPLLPEFVIYKKNERRRDVVLTYVDGQGKSGASYAGLYAEENGIAAECIIERGVFRERFTAHRERHGPVAALIIMDDIAATGKSLAENVEEFISQCGDLLKLTKIRIVTLVSTDTAQANLARMIGKYTEAEGIDVDFRTCEILPPEQFAFPTNATVWGSPDVEARAKALCIDLGSRIYRKNPLGYGGMGLLVVFPTTVPNNTLPILHSFSKTGSSQPWTPLFSRPVH